MAEDLFQSATLWTQMDKTTIDSYDVLPEAAIRMSELMENMSAAELGQAVPYIHIHELHPDGSLGRRISTDLYQPPRFGQPLDHRFAERPNVSIESIKVKYQMPRGWILYRELDFNIVVHRPDAVFSAASGSLVQSLLDFTKQHVIFYGWQGGTSVIANGPPPEKKDLDLRNRGVLGGVGVGHGGGAVDIRQVMPTKATIRFKVTHYNFQIEPDMQVKFQIHAVEDGEIATRDAVVFNNRHILPIFDDPSIGLDDADRLFDTAVAYFLAALREKLKTFDIEVTDKKTGTVAKQPALFVRLKDVFDIFFADPILFSCHGLGYKDVRLHLGLFNKSCPRTSAAWGNFDYADKRIGDFNLPLKYITDLVSRITTTNSQMTAYGMIREIIGAVGSPEAWERKSDDKFKIPEMILQTRYNSDRSFALFQLMDRKYRIEQLNIGVGDYPSKKALRKSLREKKIPELNLMRSLTYIKDIKFEVVNDEQMKSIFIRRSINKTRTDIAANDSRNQQLYGGMPGFAMMYRSAIKGSFTMIGNFAFDVFGVMWFNFDIPAYDGLFYVLMREDTVDNTGFYTTLTLQAEGLDPLRGAPAGKQSKVPRWITGNGERSMMNWVQAMILLKHPEEAARLQEEKHSSDNGI